MDVINRSACFISSNFQTQSSAVFGSVHIQQWLPLEVAAQITINASWSRIPQMSKVNHFPEADLFPEDS